LCNDSLNKQTGHLKNGKQAGKKKELLKTYENITKEEQKKHISDKWR